MDACKSARPSWRAHNVSLRFSAVLLAGGKSRRMGCNKAFVEIGGLPLWRRQMMLLEELAPAELMISGQPCEEWNAWGHTVVQDAQQDAGPLAGIAASLLRCSTPLLIVLAVDLPGLTSDYMRRLLGCCSDSSGAVPINDGRFEPVVAIYPARAATLAQRSLEQRQSSLQVFAQRCVAEELVRAVPVSAHDKPLFVNMNTPADLAVAASFHSLAR